MIVETKYENSPLMVLYEALCNGFEKYFYVRGYARLRTYNPDRWEKISDITANILNNNGCKYNEEAGGRPCFTEYELIEGEYYLQFVIDWLGNDVNECFDIYQIDGTCYIVVFLDYFKDMIKEIPDDDESVEALAARAIGRSVYYDAICKIVRVFILMVYNPALALQDLAVTAAARCLRYAPSIIAIRILDYYVYNGIRQEDIPDMPIKEAKDYLSSSLPLMLVGIYKLS